MGGGKLWTDAEHSRLRGAWNEYVRDPDPDRGTVKEFDERMAAELGRSANSVRNRRDVLELQMEHGGAQSGDMPTEKPWASGVIDEARNLDLLDYTFSDGSYYFPVAGGLYKIDEETWEYVCQEYSEMGGNKTAKEVAREIGVSVAVLRTCLRLANQYKASLPLSRESLVSGDPDELADRTLAAKEREILAKFERRKRLTWEREYLALKQWKLSEDRFVENAAAIVGERPVPEPVKIIHATDDNQPSTKTFVVHAPTADEHIGLLVWKDEAFGEHYDTGIACQRLREHADRTAEWVADQPGRCETLHRSFLGDLFHALSGETEHGTVLHQDTRAAKVFDAGLEAVEYSIQRARQVADRVEVHFCPGNHDGSKDLFMFFRAVERSFREVDDVVVHVHPRRTSAFRVGETLHVIDHGYGLAISGWKGKAQAEIVARAAEGFEGAETIVSYSGHLHSPAADSLGAHHSLIRLPGLTEVDDYATDLRYSHRPAAKLFRLDDCGRIETERTLFFGPGVVAPG